MTNDALSISPGSRLRAAMTLAIIADALQILVFPLFVEGAESPADDIFDFGMAAVLVRLLGWHWEFLPSFFAKLVPGVDLVPFVDVGGCKRLSKVEAGCSHHRRNSRGKRERAMEFVTRVWMQEQACSLDSAPGISVNTGGYRYQSFLSAKAGSLHGDPSQIGLEAISRAHFLDHPACQTPPSTQELLAERFSLESNGCS